MCHTIFGYCNASCYGAFASLISTIPTFLGSRLLHSYHDRHYHSLIFFHYVGLRVIFIISGTCFRRYQEHATNFHPYGRSPIYPLCTPILGSRYYSFLCGLHFCACNLLYYYCVSFHAYYLSIPNGIVCAEIGVCFRCVTVVSGVCLTTAFARIFGDVPIYQMWIGLYVIPRYFLGLLCRCCNFYYFCSGF